MKSDDKKGRSLRSIALVATFAMAMSAGVLGANLSPDNAFTARAVHAQEADTADLSGHPIVGSWLVTTPGGPALALFAADGSVVQGVQGSQVGVMGVGADATFVSAEIGTWAPTSDRGAHFTALQVLSSADGTYLGTVTIDGHPVVSEDGQTLVDDGSQAEVTVRDETGAIISILGEGDENLPAITGTRMGVGAPGFASNASAESTPAQTAVVVADEELIRETEQERLNALVNADMETADLLTADDFQLINPAGGTMTKEEYLGGIASGDIDYIVFEPASPIAVRLHDVAAIIRYQSNIHIVVGGEDIVTHGWHTDLYELRDGRWQAVWSQMTEIQ